VLPPASVHIQIHRNAHPHISGGAEGEECENTQHKDRFGTALSKRLDHPVFTVRRTSQWANY